MPDDTVTAGAREVSIVVPRTARYYRLGGRDDDRPPAELWIVLHGYAQLGGRFIRHFRPIAGESRLVVAPEALNRFYVQGPGGVAAHAQARVGATWMTREDREREIADQRTYLDAVLAEVRGAWPAARQPRLVVLGFSQGVATAVRWVTRSAFAPDRLIAWAGGFPQELDAAGAGRLEGRVTVVAGRSDVLVPEANVHTALAHLATLGLRPPVAWYDGGHAIDGATLERVAGEA